MCGVLFWLLVLLLFYLRNHCLIEGHKDLHFCFFLLEFYLLHILIFDPFWDIFCVIWSRGSVSSFSCRYPVAIWVCSCLSTILEKEVAVHASVLALEIPWTEEPGRLLSVWLQTVRHHWAWARSTIWWKTVPFPLNCLGILDKNFLITNEFEKLFLY